MTQPNFKEFIKGKGLTPIRHRQKDFNASLRAFAISEKWSKGKMVKSKGKREREGGRKGGSEGWEEGGREERREVGKKEKRRRVERKETENERERGRDRESKFLL